MKGNILVTFLLAVMKYLEKQGKKGKKKGGRKERKEGRRREGGRKERRKEGKTLESTYRKGCEKTEKRQQSGGLSRNQLELGLLTHVLLSLRSLTQQCNEIL